MPDAQRIFEIKVQGLVKSLEDIAKFQHEIDVLTASLQELKDELDFSKSTGNSQAVEILTNKIKLLEKEKEELAKKEKALTNETNARTKAEKDGQTQTEANTKASKANADAVSVESEKYVTLASRIKSLNLEREKFATIGTPITINGLPVTDKQAAEEVQRLKALQTELNAEVKIGKQNIDDSNESLKEQEDIYNTLAERIKQLSILREQFQTKGTPIVFEGNPLTDQQALNTLTELKLLQSQIKQEENVSSDIIKNKNINLQKGVSILTQERQQLESILSVTKEGDDVFFKRQILSYTDAKNKLEEFRLAEESQIITQQKLTEDINNQTNAVSKLINREEQLNNIVTVLQKKNKDGVDVAFSFEGKNIDLEKALQLQKETNSERVKSQEILSTLNSEQSQINIKTQEEENIRKANLINEQGSLDNLKAQASELSKQIGKRNINSLDQTPVTIGENTIQLSEAIELRNRINKLIQDEEFKINNSTSAVKNQKSAYDQLLTDIKQLENLTSSAIFNKEDTTTYQGITRSISESVQKTEELKTRQIELNSIYKNQKSIIDQTNLLRTKEIQELSLILKTTKEDSSINLKGKILSYQQVQDKLANLQTQENLESAIQKKIQTDIQNTTADINNQIERRIILNQSITTAKSTNIAPFSPQIGVTFEDKTITLREAENIQKNINLDQIKSETILTSLNQKQSEITSRVQQEENIRKANLVAEEGSLNNLKEERDLLNRSIANRNTDRLNPTPVTLTDGTQVSANAAIERRNFLNKLIDITESKLNGEDQILKKQITEYDILINSRKQLQNLTSSAVVSNKSSVDFNGVTFSTQTAIDLTKKMQTEENNLIDLFKREKNEHEQIAISEENSILKIKAQASIVKTALQSINPGTQTVTFQDINTGKNTTTSTDAANASLASYQKTIKDYNDAQKLRLQLEGLVSGGMKELALQTKLLTDANFQLSASSKEVGLNLTQSQFDKIKSTIIGIVPEIGNFTLAEVNAGKASEFLTQVLFKNNAALHDFKLSASGSNTLVGDYTKGIVDAFKNLGLGSVLAKDKFQIDNEIKQILIRITELKAAYDAALKSGDPGIRTITQDLIKESQTYTDLTSKVKTLNTAFENSHTVGEKITGSISQGFKNLDQTIGRTLFTYIGFQAAISGVQRLISADKQLSDQSADLQRVLGATKDETTAVTEELKKLDTRTSIVALQGFSIIAARAGVLKENIAGVTSAINKLQLVAGNELGDIDTATTSIVKLINIFEGAGAVTEASVLKVGNAIVQLSNEGVASGAFLVNFAERLAGIKGSTNISQAAVFGLSAAFEETGQTSEIAATSIAQVLNRISADVPKYAAIAGKATESFRTLLRENPAEAVIQLAEGLRSGGTAADEIGASFAKLGLSGVRIRNTLQDVGANAEFFRKRISDANSAILDQSTILEGSANKQLTFAATIDKIGASITKAADNKNFVNLLDSIAKVTLGLIKALLLIPFQAIIIGISGLTALWALYKGQAISVALVDALMNKQSALNFIARKAEYFGLINLTAAQKIKQAADELSLVTLKKQQIQAAVTAGVMTEEAATTELAAIATTSLNAAIKISPIGIFLALLGLILPLVGAFASKTEAATVAISDQNRKLHDTISIQKDIQTQVVESTSKIELQVKSLIAVINDESLSVETRIKAYHTLIQIQSEFTDSVTITHEGLVNEGITIGNLMQVYDQFIIKIRDLARAKAIASIGQKSQDDLASSDLKIFSAEQDKIEADKIAKNQKLLDQQKRQQDLAQINQIQDVKARQLALRDFNATGQQTDNSDVFKKQAEADKALIDAKKEHLAIAKDATLTTSFISSETSNLNKEIDKLNVKIKASVAGSAEELALTKQKNDIQARIDETLTITQPTKGLTPEAALEGLNTQLINKQTEIDKTIQLVEALKLEKKEKGVLNDSQKLQVYEDNNRLTQLFKDKADLQKRIKQLDPNAGKIPSTSTGRPQVERDDFNEIEAIRAKDIAEENNRFAQINVIRKATLEEDIVHLRTLQNINDTADTEKITKLTETLNKTISLEHNASGQKLKNFKSDVLREKKDIADAEAAIATRSVQTNDQVLAAEQAFVDKLVIINKKQLEARKSQAQLQFETISTNPDSTNTEIAKAHKQLDDTILQETILHYNYLIRITESYNLSTEKLEEEKDKAIADALRASLQDQRDLYKAFFKDIEREEQINISNINNKINTIRDNILNSNKSSRVQTIELANIGNIQNVLDSIEKLKDATKAYNQALEDVKNTNREISADSKNEAANQSSNALNELNKPISTLTQLEINALHDAATKAHSELKAALDELNKGINDYSNAQSSITSVIGNLFGKAFSVSKDDITKANATGDFSAINAKINKQKELAQVISETFALAQTAMQNYFDSERNHLEASRVIAQQRIDIETQQLKNRAQSQAEQTSIDEQAAAKKKTIDQKAFEEDKKLKLAQAKLNLGLELSNIALLTAANLSPANLASLGTLGLVLYAVQAALAIARYISTVSNIQSAQFTGEYGLQAQRGGKVKGSPHSRGGEKFKFNGTVYEDEVDEIRVIRTKNAPKNQKFKLSGTQEEIASALNHIGGGINFTPGALITKLEYGGSVNKFSEGGSVFTLNPPINPSSFLNVNNNNNSNSDNSEIKKMVIDLGKSIELQSNNLDILSQQTNNRIDKLKVVVVAGEVEETNKNTKKAKSLGTF